MTGKMTKAEMAAQMGITPQQLAEKEAENKVRFSATTTAPVSAPETHPRATTEEPSRMDKFKGLLKEGFNAVAGAVTATVDLAVGLTTDPAGTIRQTAEKTEIGDAVKRGNTSDSELNRRIQRQERELGI